MATLGTKAGVIEKENTDNNTVEENFTEEETRNNLKMKEDDFIAGMLQAAEDRTAITTRIEIIRGGKLYFAFNIHGLSDEEARQCRKKHTHYVKNKNIGVRFEDYVDQAKFRSSLIYHATTEEDRAKLWDNKKIWNALMQKGFQIVTALDVIEATLNGGEKDRVIDEINVLSGFEAEDTEEVTASREELAKN